ncbi:hypothetical protein ACOSQ4_031255 [Xanthoceras sorbifolium]
MSIYNIDKLDIGESDLSMIGNAISMVAIWDIVGPDHHDDDGLEFTGNCLSIEMAWHAMYRIAASFGVITFWVPASFQEQKCWNWV